MAEVHSGRGHQARIETAAVTAFHSSSTVDGKPDFKGNRERKWYLRFLPVAFLAVISTRWKTHNHVGEDLRC